MMNEKTVLITGGNEGIGYELARCYARDHCRVLIAARNDEKLKHAAGMLKREYSADVHCFCIDLGKPGASRRLYDAVRKQDLQVDVLVNNAGIGFAGRSWEIPVEKEEALVMVNDVALMSLTKLFLKDMTERRNGMIINIASTGAFQPGPYIAAYYASKAFVLSYTKAVQKEAEEYGVKVICYCPGPVDTAFYEKSGGKKTIGAVSPERCAKDLYKQTGKHAMIIPGFLNKAMLAVPAGIRTAFIQEMKKKNL
ncbi:MAG: SDR family oxidoreductase [Bulleidia sp.]|nr:SDR family oxidoreductase [Bulleidia sp.]